MTRAFIGVGSNIEPERHILAAFDELSAAGLPVRSSSRFYRTAAIDRPDQPDYANGVWLCPTQLALAELRPLLRTIEARLGRVRTADRYAARTIDLDLLLFGEAVVEDGGLILPDPHIMQRPFLAACLAELDPMLILPGRGIAIRELLRTGLTTELGEYSEISTELHHRLETTQ